jgi:hypothetical protein
MSYKHTSALSILLVACSSCRTLPPHDRLQVRPSTTVFEYRVLLAELKYYKCYVGGDDTIIVPEIRVAGNRALTLVLRKSVWAAPDVSFEECDLFQQLVAGRALMIIREYLPETIPVQIEWLTADRELTETQLYFRKCIERRASGLGLRATSCISEREPTWMIPE